MSEAQAGDVPEFSICLVRESRTRFTAKQICSSVVFHEVFKSGFDGLDRECCVVVSLNTKNNPIGFNVVSVGSVSLSIVHPREVFKVAVLQNAAAVIIAHNHPSGDATPSPEDQRLTDRLVEAGRILGIRVLDHIVFGDATYYSFADDDKLNRTDAEDGEYLRKRSERRRRHQRTRAKQSTTSEGEMKVVGGG